MTDKYENWLEKHEVEYCQRTLGFWNGILEKKIGGTAIHGKCQDAMASDRKL